MLMYEQDNVTSFREMFTNVTFNPVMPVGYFDCTTKTNKHEITYYIIQQSNQIYTKFITKTIAHIKNKHSGRNYIPQLN